MALWLYDPVWSQFHFSGRYSVPTASRDFVASPHTGRGNTGLSPHKTQRNSGAENLPFLLKFVVGKKSSHMRNSRFARAKFKVEILEFGILGFPHSIAYSSVDFRLSTFV